MVLSRQQMVAYLVALGYLWLAATASARGNFGSTSSFVFDSATGTEVQVYSPFNGVPNQGFLPVNIVIRNGFGTPRQWTFSFRSYSADRYRANLEFASSFTYTVEGNAEIADEVMIPLASILKDTYSNNEVQVIISSRGGRSRSGELSSYSFYEWPAMAMSNGLDGKLDNLNRLSTHVHSNYSTSRSVRGSEPIALLFESLELPRDWRGYTGFDVFMMTQSEWLGIQPAVRRAILDWVRFGGSLFLFTDSSAAPSAMGVELPKGRYGLGQVRHENWDGERINVRTVSQKIMSTERKRLLELGRDYAEEHWQLQKDFGSRPFNPFLVFVILVAFAVVVGPVNLFVLAKPGMRHRMFLTTPVISLIASLLLILIILFQDGFGGSGRRIALMILESAPGERSEYVIQEQITRTGVLLGRSFGEEDATYVTPVPMRKSRWTHYDNLQMGPARYRMSDGMIGGDWFRSRSEQAHYVQSVRPTRARIERLDPAATGAPRLFSSMDLTLSKFFYIDPGGKIWEANGRVTAGQEIELAASDQNALDWFWSNSSVPFSSSLRNRMRLLLSQRDVYLAQAAGQSDSMIGTLPSIRWREDQLLVVGSPVDRETNPSNYE